MSQRPLRSDLPRNRAGRAFVLFLVLAACNDDGDGSGGVPVDQATADVLITDAAADDLSSFSAEIASVRLQREDLTFTGDLVGSAEVEFLGLAGSSVLLAHESIPADTYVGVEIGFTPGSYRAADEAGQPVTVVAVSDTFLAELPVPVALEDDDYLQFQIDLDLEDSLSGDVAAGTIDFDPSGSCSSDDGSDEAALDELKGIVVSSSAGDETFEIDAFVGDEVPVELGTLTVETDAQTLFLDDDGTELTSTLFYAALVDGSTLLEVHGGLGLDGVVAATRVEIEDQAGGVGSQDLVRIEGLVFDVQATQLQLQVLEIEDGETIAGPILDALAEPEFILVSFDAATVFLVEDTVATSSELAVGQRVKVKFCAFATEPFPACRVEIEDEDAEFEGTITDVALVPASFVVHLEDGEPAILAGLVQDTSTDVTVDLASSSLFLDTQGEPALLPADLLPELEVEAHGTLSGPATGPTITASRTKVFAGRLEDAVVIGTNELAASFTTTGGEIVDPFGTGVTPGPQDVLIQPGCVFEGDVDSAAEFFQLFEGKVEVQVDVHGIGSGSVTPNEILAFEVDVDVL